MAADCSILALQTDFCRNSIALLTEQSILEWPAELWHNCTPEGLASKKPMGSLCCDTVQANAQQNNCKTAQQQRSVAQQPSGYLQAHAKALSLQSPVDHNQEHTPQSK